MLKIALDSGSEANNYSYELFSDKSLGIIASNRHNKGNLLNRSQVNSRKSDNSGKNGGNSGAAGGDDGGDSGDDSDNKLDENKYQGHLLEYVKLYKTVLRQRFKQDSSNTKTSLFELIKENSTKIYDAVDKSIPLRMHTRLYNIKLFRDNLLLDGNKFNREIWICKSDGEHAGVKFKVFFATKNTFYFVCSVDEYGRPAPEKTESLKGCTFSRDKLIKVKD